MTLFKLEHRQGYQMLVGGMRSKNQEGLEAIFKYVGYFNPSDEHI